MQANVEIFINVLLKDKNCQNSRGLLTEAAVFVT